MFRYAIAVASVAGAAFAVAAFGGTDGSKTKLISKTSGGAPAIGGSSTVGEISPAGRFVVFQSDATNLPGAASSGSQIYIRDRETGKTRLVSRTSGGDAASGGVGSFDPSISATGRFVAFESSATNLPGSISPDRQIYVRDQETGKTKLVSKTSGGQPADADNEDASISGSGRFVLFESEATNLPGSISPDRQVYLRDLKTGKTKLVSKTTGGVPADAYSNNPAISRNGRFLGFESESTNLPGGLGGGEDQVYVRDRKTGKTKLVSRTSSGEPADADSEDVMVSASGRFVGFESLATNLPGSIGPTSTQVYLRDREQGTTTLVSRRNGGDPASGGDSHNASISDSGRFVAFQSEATNLGGLGTGVEQVFIRDRRAGKTRLVSKANDGSPADGSSFIGRNARVLTGDGRFGVFSSAATNLPGSIEPIYSQVYIRGPLP